MAVITNQFSHTREIDNKDKFFIIQLIFDDKKYEVGYIEKKFNEAEFKYQLGIIAIDIKNIIEFKSKKEYYNYKVKYANKVNF